ncbi:hypothetical protein OSB04_018896 [Centaurea solstitialis]|uniref:Myb/SANT-like domain-containing protein n=1 Tax=Centaurea solstitialis TaxID=347529 RepID=A0AA38T8R6_9ASTR|nr:hypothetical protein OSB04_018896 [Centaurea solstitialis]
MEQTAESNQQKRPRISWKDHNVVKTFLEACILEVGLNGKEGSSLKALSWKKVAETLKTTHNFIVDRKQMRNHFDYLKGKYGAWLKLKNKTGNVYDPSTNTFNLTPEEWDLEIEGGMSVGLGGHGPRSKDPLPTTEPFVVINDEVPLSSDQDPLSSSPTPTSRAPVAKPKGKKNANVNSDLDYKLIKFLLGFCGYPRIKLIRGLSQIYQNLAGSIYLVGLKQTVETHVIRNSLFRSKHAEAIKAKNPLKPNDLNRL